MIMAAALLLTQCKKPSITFPTPSVTTTVSMTITAGPGSKTDISTMGGIVWSENDKIYVGDGSKYVGCLAIQSGVGNATGTFTGDVTVTTGTHTFHFYYLGSSDYTGSLASGTSTTVDVDFSSQNIYEENGKLKNASGQHVGYGKAENVEVEADKPVMGLEVTMKSKVAIAYFCFQKGEGESANPYTGALTLSGDHIYNKMTVKFNVSDFDFTPVKDGNISLANTTTHLKYAMLVPTGSTAEETLNFGGVVTGSTTLANGIEANKFYRIDGNMPIVVTIKPIEFSVAADTKVKFAPGNLYYDADDNECHWKFEANQWDFRTYDGLGSCIGGVYSADSGTPSGDWGLFGWSTGAANNNWGMHTKTSSTTGYTDGDFKDWGGITDLPDNAGGKTWRTLSWNEWKYLLNIDNVSSGARTDANRFAKAKVNGVNGLLIFPDGYNNNVRIPDGSITGVANVNEVETINYPLNSIPADTWAAMESSGVVFLPAAGYREGTSMNGVGTDGFYWSNLFLDSQKAFYMGFDLSSVGTNSWYRYTGGSVRLVRSAS